MIWCIFKPTFVCEDRPFVDDCDERGEEVLGEDVGDDVGVDCVVGNDDGDDIVVLASILAIIEKLMTFC